MNELIKKELQNIHVAELPDYDDSTLQLKIPRGTRDADRIQFEKGKYYKIELANYIVHPYEGFNLHVQWNHNIIPKDTIMNVEVLDIMGKMIKVTGCGDSNVPWTGWLPIISVKLLTLL